MDPGEGFLSDLIAGQYEQHKPGRNNDNGHNDPVDDDASLFLVTLIDEMAVRDIFGDVESCLDNVSGTTAANQLQKMT